MPRIETFVFFDIETTGLPWQEKNQTKITELCFLAASRTDIENTAQGQIPPMNKLTEMFNPCRLIHPAVTKLTGLTNDYLKNLPVFKQKEFSIVGFLNCLPKPVCLVAHNGNSFDFKIFLAECKDANFCLPSDILCADSLVWFRKLFQEDLSAKIKTEISEHVCEWPDLNLSTQEWQEIDNICQNEPSTISNNNKVKKGWLEEVAIKKIDQQKILKEKRLFNKDLNDVMTDDEDDWPVLNPNTEELEDIDNISLSISNISCSDKQNNLNHTEKAPMTCKKNVRNQEEKKEKMKLSLGAIYSRLVGKKVTNAHRAEGDCLMLLECVVAASNFLSWADTACKPLLNIKPLERY